jgi:hypothetical protein
MRQDRQRNPRAASVADIIFFAQKGRRSTREGRGLKARTRSSKENGRLVKTMRQAFEWVRAFAPEPANSNLARRRSRTMAQNCLGRELINP